MSVQTEAEQLHNGLHSDIDTFAKLQDWHNGVIEPKNIMLATEIAIRVASQVGYTVNYDVDVESVSLGQLYGEILKQYLLALAP